MTSPRPVVSFEVLEPAPTSETTKDDAMIATSRIVSNVQRYLEKLEVEGKISGGSRHVAQQIAQRAADEVESNWIE